MKIEYLPPTSLLPEQHVEIEALSGDWPGVYPSRIRSVVGREISLDAPLRNGVWVPLRAETPLIVRANSPYGLVSFDTRVVDRRPGPPPTVEVARPARLMAIQRRSLYRVEARLPVLFDRAEGTEPASAQIEAGILVNLSGNGAALRSALPLRSGEWLRLRLPLSDRDGELLVAAQVVGADTRRARFDTERIARLHFYGLSARDEDRLFRLVTTLDRARLRQRRTLRDA